MKVATGPGFRFNTSRPAVLLALAMSVSPALAEQVNASGEQALRVQSSIDFRIHIPEVLHVNSRPEQRAKSYSFVSRTTELQADRMVVTVVKP